VDPRFLAYQRSLFSPAALTLDPGKLTASELADVHKSARAFLTLLSPHFLSPGCFKTLEFLLRKYKQVFHLSVLFWTRPRRATSSDDH